MTTATAGDWVVETRGLVKHYGKKVKALRGVNLNIGRGEVFGLLGPNGAGKSTLVKILMTVIGRTNGSGTMLGHPIGDKSALSRVGYLPEHHRFPGYLKGAQVIDFFGAMAGVPRKQRRIKTGELLEIVNMTEWAKTPVRKYSKGMRQRIGLAQALVNDPDFVVLDEPTDGVDPVGRREIRDVVKRMGESGKAVLVNSHLLGELEMVCDRVAILVKGVVATQGTLDELAVGQARYEIEVAGEGEGESENSEVTAPGAGRLAEMIAVGNGEDRALGSGEKVDVAGSTVRVYTEEATVVAPVLAKALDMGLLVRSMKPVRPTLEDLFMQAVTDPETGKELKPGADRGKAPKPAGGAA
ncbi:MAG: ABC transporter ATP-binding protein [Planctomycetota bacterium]